MYPLSGVIVYVLDMHLFGATASLSLISALISIIRSMSFVLPSILISIFAFRIELNSTVAQTLLTSLYATSIIELAFLVSR